MNEEESRKAIVKEALSWIGTPYISNAMVKGRGGGTDCAMLPLGVFINVGLIDKSFDPRPYPPEWHIHQNEERYLAIVKSFAKQVANPPEREPKPGDFVLFKIGNLFAHGGIVIKWPHIVHAVGNDMVLMEDVSKNTIGKRALMVVPQLFFSIWD